MSMSSFRRNDPGKNRVVDRVAAGIILVLLLLLAPWPLFLATSLFLLLWFPNYYEAIVASTLFDLLYRPEIVPFHASWSMTLVIIMAAFAVEVLRNRIRLPSV